MGNWSCISHKSFSGNSSSSPSWLAEIEHHVGERGQRVLTIRISSAVTNAARSSANVADRLCGKRQQLSTASVGMSSALLTQDCFSGLIYCSCFYLFSFHVNSPVSELHHAFREANHKGELSFYLMVDKTFARRNGSARLKQLSLISIIHSDAMSQLDFCRHIKSNVTYRNVYHHSYTQKYMLSSFNSRVKVQGQPVWLNCSENLNWLCLMWSPSTSSCILCHCCNCQNKARAEFPAWSVDRKILVCLWSTLFHSPGCTQHINMLCKRQKILTFKDDSILI